jgi:hypothetical protein
MKRAFSRLILNRKRLENWTLWIRLIGGILIVIHTLSS